MTDAQARRLVDALEAVLAYAQQVHDEAQEAGNPGIDWSLAEFASQHAYFAVQAVRRDWPADDD